MRQLHRPLAADQMHQFAGYRPSSREIDRLIARASAHPLGLGFLRDGSLDSVAAVFEVHAFTVEKATLENDILERGDAQSCAPPPAEIVDERGAGDRLGVSPRCP